jgi:hypothetical protein
MTASERLRRLEQILSASSAAPVSAVDERDAATGHMESLPLERIRQLSALVDQQRAEADEVDAVVMRLLLNDYTAAVGHLRAVTRDAGSRLEAAAGPVADLRRFLWRDEKLREALQHTADGVESGARDEPGPADEPR